MTEDDSVRIGARSSGGAGAFATCGDALRAAMEADGEDEALMALGEVLELGTAVGTANAGNAGSSSAGAADAAGGDETVVADVVRGAVGFASSSESVKVRNWCVEACEAFGKAREDALGECATTLGIMTRDADATTAKRAAIGFSRLFREALIVAAVKGNASRVLKQTTQAWTSAKVAMDAVADVASSAEEGVGVRMACAKTTETAVLALAGEGWGSNVVKPGHKTLNLEEMMQDAVRLADRLQEALRADGDSDQPGGPLTLVLIGALGKLSVKRAELATGCMPGLIEYAKAHVAGHKAEVEQRGTALVTTASVSKELKTVLLDVLRNGPTQAVEGGLMNEMSTICRDLGAGDAVDSALRHRERTTHSYGEKRASFLSPAGNLKRARMREREREPVAPPPPPPLLATAAMTDPGILHQILTTLAVLVGRNDRSMLDAFVTQLAPPALADAILANLEHLPPASQYYLAGRGANARAPPPPPPISAMVAAPEPEEQAEPLSVIVKVDDLDADVAEAFRLEAIQRMIAVGSSAEEYGGAEKLTLSGPLRASLLARLASSGAAKSEGASMEEETLAIASALLFTAEGGGVYEIEGVNMLLKWLTTLYAQEVAYDFSYVPYDHALSAAIECLTRGVAGATSTTAMASGAKNSLSQLLCDVPSLPGVVWESIRMMCRLVEYSEGEESKFPTSDETVALALSVLQDVTLERPPARAEALKVCLECATCSDESVRGKAIRLIANRLHPVKHLTDDIESYAKESLQRGREIGEKSLVEAKEIVERAAAVKREEMEAKDGQDDDEAMEDADQAEARARAEEQEEETVDHVAKAGDAAVGSMLLYCALCARNYKLLPGLFEVYATLSPELQEALHRPVIGLSRACGPNCLELCEIIANPPEGSLKLAVQCLNTLASVAAIPAPATLLDAAAALSTSQGGDVQYLAPLVCSFDEERVRDLLPAFIHASSDIFASVLDTILALPEEDATLSPVAIFIAVHEVQVGQSGVTLKQLVDACSACFDRPDVFTPQVLATALQQMVEFTPLPLLFMRTLMQAETAAPQLKDFTLGLLRTLLNRQVWKMDSKIWDGFLRSLRRAAPQSYPLMIELPAPTLADALDKFPAMREGLVAFASNPAVAPTVPKPVAAILFN
jgi:hypothetical protein